MFKTLFAASAIVIVGAAAQAEQMSTQELQAELQALRSEVTQLRTAQSQDWMNERRAEEIKTLVREVLSDADTRASLLDSSITAGHNGDHFFLSSEDGNFEMAIYGQLQVRYTANFRDSNPGSGTDEGEAGFNIPRAKIGFAGTVVNPRIHYDVRLNANRDDETVFTDKVVIGYDLTDEIYIWAGEDKAPFLREELINSSHQLAVERSLVNEAFTLDRVQGVGVKWNAHEQVKLAAMVHDGARSGESTVTTSGAPAGLSIYNAADFTAHGNISSSDIGKDFQNDRTDFAVTARGDVLLAGDWAQWKDYSSWAGEELFVNVGAAIAYEVGETGDTGNNTNHLSWTVDATVEYQGFALSAAYVGSSIDIDDAVVGVSDFDPWGVMVQGSYNMDLGNKTSLEPFVRYEFIDLDDFGGILPSTIDDDFTLITFGANWYHAKHDAKLSADIVWSLDSLPTSVSGLGLLADDTGEEDQIALRVQYQLLF